MNIIGWGFTLLFSALLVMSLCMLWQIVYTLKAGTIAKAVVTEVRVDIAARLDSQYVLCVRTDEAEPKDIVTRSGFSLSSRIPQERVQQRIDEWNDAEVTIAYRMTKGGKTIAYVKELAKKEIAFSAFVIAFSIAMLAFVLIV